MLNGATLNSGTLNGPTVFDAAASSNTDSRHTVCPGRNRIKKRHRGASIMLVFENKDHDTTWVLEAMNIVARTAGERLR